MALAGDMLSIQGMAGSVGSTQIVEAIGRLQSTDTVLQMIMGTESAIGTNACGGPSRCRNR